MNQNKFIYGEQFARILVEWIDTFRELSDEDKFTAFQIFYYNKTQNTQLYKLYDCLKKNEEYMNNEGFIQYTLDKDYCILQYGGMSLKLQKHVTMLLLSGILELTDQLLPLGSVVTLNNNFNLNNKEKPYYIITHRFIVQDDMSGYFSYAGVPYPFGEMKDNRLLHFTIPAIDKVIFRGFSDDSDQAFILLMKENLLLRLKVHSVSFMKLYNNI